MNENTVEGYFEAKRLDMLNFSGFLNGVQIIKGKSQNVKIESVIINNMKQDGFSFYPRKYDQYEPAFDKPVDKEKSEPSKINVDQIVETIVQKNPDAVNKTGTYKGDPVEIIKETDSRLIIIHNGKQKTVGKNVVVRN